MRTYASGLDFHLTDSEYVQFFSEAAALGYRGFKIKVGHPDVEWDLNRLGLLRDAVGGLGPVMVDANEAWSPREAVRRLDIYRRAGFDILWVEDPCIGTISTACARSGPARPGCMSTPANIWTCAASGG